MAGKRVLDTVAILSVSRKVVQKHVELRSRQIEILSKTSSLASGIRNQSEKVTQTFKAASFLTSRLGETPVSKKVPDHALSHTKPALGQNKPEDDLSFKTSYKSGDSNEALLQEDPSQNHFPPAPSKKSLDCLANPLDDKKTQPGDKGTYEDINHTTPEQETIPENVDINLFHSSRVARLLGGRVQKHQKKALDLKHAKRLTTDDKNSVILQEQDYHYDSKLRSSQVRSSNEPVSEFKLEVKENLCSPTSTNYPGTGEVINTSSKLRESSVPASRIARLWNYGSLAAGMFGGVISEGFRRATIGDKTDTSYILNENNMNRLVTKLSKMRGAALKIGQMISFQDTNMLPAPVQDILQRVQDRADYMPPYQRDRVLRDNLGPNWREMFSSFDEIPLAAASIGQVHRATLKSNGAQVAVKVQYPGVAESIDSDLKNLAILLTASKLLPKGLFLDKTIANARTELAWECDYLREAECAHRFKLCLRDELDVFTVPHVYSEASGRQVLTMEFMNGTAITKIKNLDQDQKDWIGTQILRLCLREIIEFRFMQTDPNWTNFLYNKETGKLELLDFGASREYSKDFISKYAQLLAAASRSDRESLEKLSIDLGYLTGFESKSMLDAHISSVLTLAEPFLDTSPHLYDFRDQTITDRVRGLIPVMIRERLAPPPEETYSLHRKLSGAFLLCARLGSRVSCRKLFEESFGKARLI